MYKNEHKGKINFNHIMEACKKRYIPFERVVERQRKPLSLVKAIEEAKEKGRNPIISEIKYRSPTKDNRETGRPGEIALEMIKGGACAISVLTEPEFFGGSLENLRRVKSVAAVPVMRKDFVFHPTQIPESYYYGADSILLISSFFSETDLRRMIDDARSYGMDPLVEVHNEQDIAKATSAGAVLYAVNNRDKDTLEIDLNRTGLMAPLIEGIVVSASGLETPESLKRVLNHADAALIGSSIMGSNDITSAVKGFVEA
jgi:indole-3-glycerol phosphate synthase